MKLASMLAHLRLVSPELKARIVIEGEDGASSAVTAPVVAISWTDELVNVFPGSLPGLDWNSMSDSKEPLTAMDLVQSLYDGWDGAPVQLGPVGGRSYALADIRRDGSSWVDLVAGEEIDEP